MVIKSVILKKDTLSQTQTTLDIVRRQEIYTVCYNRSSCIVKNCDTLESALAVFNSVVNNETKFVLTSDRYPGWVWEKTLEQGREHWFRMKEGVNYAISGIKTSCGKMIIGELMTKQGGTWNPARFHFDGLMSDCVKEAERRTAYRLAKEAERLTACLC